MKRCVTHSQRGVSLLEVLVALMVLSVGLLGLSALHWRTAQQSHAIMGQSLAALHAQDAAERLWLLSCWNATQGEKTLEDWAKNPPPTLPDWQATWLWHTSNTGGVQLQIIQQWARLPEPFQLTFTVPTPVCRSTP